MELKHDEKVTLDNFTAHYEVILGNTRIANAELEKALEAEKNAKDSITELTAKAEELATEVNGLLIRRDAVVKETDNKLALLQRREESATAKEAETSAHVDKELARLGNERRTLDADIASKTEQHTEAEARLVVLKESVRITSAQVESLSEKVTTLSKEVADLERTKASLELEVTEAEQAHETKKKEMADELAEIRRITDEEKAKMILSQDYYDKKDAEYAGRERDILIVTKRLKELFNEVKPGTVLKI